MNCRRARKEIPLLAGGDLAVRKAGKLEKHLRACADCRRELMEYRAALAGIKTVAEKDEVRDWPESEWKALIKNVISQKAEPRESVHKASPRLAWAYGFAVLALLAVGGFPFKVRDPQTEGNPGRARKGDRQADRNSGSGSRTREAPGTQKTREPDCGASCHGKIPAN